MTSRAARERTLEIEATTSGEACTTYDNTATATATNAPSDTDNAVIHCLKPSISITKTAEKSPIDAGDTAKFTIAVSNAGPGAAYAVKVKDPLPSGLTWSEDSADCSIAADPGNANLPTLFCDYADLASGASRSVNLTATTSFQACATYANTASVSGSNFATKQASDTIECKKADLQVVKSAVATTVDAGDAIGFSMVTSNTGAGTAKSATLNDPLPAGVTWTIASQDDTTAPLECAITGAADSQVLHCDYGDLAPNATRTVSVSAQTSYTNCATYDNTATVDAANTPADNDSATITCKTADLTVVKTPDNQVVDAGDSISFSMVTSNTGAGTAKSATLNDPLPAGVTWTIASQDDTTAPLDCAITGAAGSQVLHCDYGNLAPNATRSVSVSAATSFTKCAIYDNTATVDASNTPADSDDGKITCKTADLKVVKTPDDQVVNAGDPISFNMVTSNAGQGTAKSVVLNDPLPAGVTWAIASQDDTSAPLECAITGAADSQVLHCDYGNLAPNATRTVSVSAQTSFTNCSVYDNTATVGSGNTPTDSDDAKITCKAAGLHVVKTADTAVVDAGDPVGFSMVTSNTGAGTAKSATLNDPLPAGVTWAIASQDDTSAPLECAITGAAGSQTLHCDYGDLGPAATRTVAVTAQTSFDACSTYDNTATVDADNTPADSDDATVTCKKPALDLTKLAVETTVSAGDKVGFTIATQNTGEGTAKDVTLSDPLPAGVTWSIASQDDTTAPLECAITGAPGSQTLDCSYGDLASHAVRTVKVEAQTDEDACATYDNTATATADNAPGDSDRAVIDCLKPHVTITKTAANSPINAGESASFTITVKNDGPAQSTGTAKAVTLKDPLASALTWTAGGANASDCTIAASQLDCDFGDLAPGATKVVTVTAPTTKAECATYENTATVDGTNFAAKTASDTVVCQKPGLTVDKVATAATVDPGDPITFKISSANSAGEGAGVAKSVTLHDPLPAGVTWSIAGQDDETAPLDCAISGGDGNQVLDCAYGDLNPGAARTVTVTATTSFEQCGVYDNTATLSASNAAQVQDGATITCRPPATVRIKKVVDGVAADATKFGFQSTLTPNAENRSGDFQLSQDDGTTSFTVRADGTTYSIKELEPYTAGYKFVSAACVQDALQAESRSKNTTTDEQRTTTVKPVSGASYTCTFVNTKLASSLLVLKGPKTQSVYLDGSASYTYDVSNPGSSDLTNVTLTDDKCSAISAPDKSTAVDPDNNGDDLLENGETWRYTCTVKAADLFKTDGGPVTNTATATRQGPGGQHADRQGHRGHEPAGAGHRDRQDRPGNRDRR